MTISDPASPDRIIIPKDTPNVAPTSAHRRNLALLTLITVAALAPFLNRAFNVDEPLFIWAAEQIHKTPANFYGFAVNWYGTVGWMSNVMKNPPLASYYIALATSIVGQSEIALHIAFLLPAIGLVLGVYQLAQKLTARPLLAAMLAFFSPVTFISATSVMCDVLMLCLSVWALVLWLNGLEKNKTSLLLAATFLAGASALTKYFGVCLLPLMFVIALIHHRRIGAWLITLLLPVAILIAYQIWTRNLYFHGLLSDLVTYAKVVRHDQGYGFIGQFLSGIAFVGGACLGMIPLLAFTCRKSIWILWIILSAALLALTFATKPFHPHPFFSPHLEVGYAIHMAVFLAAGMAVLLTAAAELRERDIHSILLVLWIFGTFLFAAFCNWTVNGRSVLPLVPAAALIVCRRFDRFAQDRSKYTIPALAPAIILTLLCAGGDTAWSNASRSASQRFAARAAKDDATLYINGHWGFQYYLECAGAYSLTLDHFKPNRGDMIAIVYNNANRIEMPTSGQWSETLESIELPPFSCVSTMNRDAHAGFYSDVFGPLPYRFGNVPPERFELLSLTSPQFPNRPPARGQP